MPADGSWRKTHAARGEAAAGPMEVLGVRQRGGDAVGSEQQQRGIELTHLPASLPTCLLCKSFKSN